MCDVAIVVYDRDEIRAGEYYLHPGDEAEFVFDPALPGNSVYTLRGKVASKDGDFYVGPFRVIGGPLPLLIRVFERCVRPKWADDPEVMGIQNTAAAGQWLMSLGNDEWVDSRGIRTTTNRLLASPFEYKAVAWSVDPEPLRQQIEGMLR